MYSAQQARTAPGSPRSSSTKESQSALRCGRAVRRERPTDTLVSALLKVFRFYHVSPVMRVDSTGVVTQFLDEAERAGVRHVTYLSAYARACGSRAARGRGGSGVVHLALPLHWASRLVYADFSETFVKPVNDEIVVPGGMTAENFVNAEC